MFGCCFGPRTKRAMGYREALPSTTAAPRFEVQEDTLEVSEEEGGVDEEEEEEAEDEARRPGESTRTSRRRTRSRTRDRRVLSAARSRFLEEARATLRDYRADPAGPSAARFLRTALRVLRFRIAHLERPPRDDAWRERLGILAAEYQPEIRRLEDEIDRDLSPSAPPAGVDDIKL